MPPEPLTKGLPPPDPRPQLNLLNPPRKKFLGTPLLPVSFPDVRVLVGDSS